MNIESATPAQREAIMTDAMDVLVLAGPGSGKTATTVARINRLMKDGIPASEIVAITFTNAAANELQRRLRPKPLEPLSETLVDIVGGAKAIDAMNKGPDLGFVGTLHSFALRMLKEVGTPFGYGERISVISPESAKDLLESKAKTVGCKTSIKELLAMKAKGRPPRSDKMDLASTVVAAFLDDLKEAGVVDYDVLLQEFLAMLAADDPRGMSAQQAIRDRFSCLFVDEVQDSAPLDWEIYRALPVAAKFYVGDPDQAIYSFRGGRVAEMIAHGRDAGTKLIKLEENFRSRAEICLVANQLISRNSTRIEKETISVKGEGGAVMVYGPANNEGEEIGRVANLIKNLVADEKRRDPYPPSIAILAPTNNIADGYRRTLTATGVQVVEQTRTDLPRDWTLARAFLELLNDPDNDALAFFYLIALYEKKGAGPKEAREAAHAVRRSAASVSKSINRANLGIGRITTPSVALEALATQNVSREAHAIAVERFRELPAGATMLDLALSMGEVREHVKEGEGDGVRIMTIHGAKGREFDIVFVVGFEDEQLPGRYGKTEDGMEEARRIAYVAVTRARRDLFIMHAASRVQVYGNHRELVARTPSRFITELMDAKEGSTPRR